MSTQKQKTCSANTLYVKKKKGTKKIEPLFRLFGAGEIINKPLFQKTKMPPSVQTLENVWF